MTMLSIRKIGVISRTYRHLNRYRHILAVLLKHGFGELVESLRIDQYLEVGLQMISKRNQDFEHRRARCRRL
jgi:ubiquinone biosynthesis protein